MHDPSSRNAYRTVGSVVLSPSEYTASVVSEDRVRRVVTLAAERLRLSVSSFFCFHACAQTSHTEESLSLSPRGREDRLETLSGAKPPSPLLFSLLTSCEQRSTLRLGSVSLCPTQTRRPQSFSRRDMWAVAVRESRRVAQQGREQRETARERERGARRQHALGPTRLTVL